MCVKNDKRPRDDGGHGVGGGDGHKGGTQMPLCGKYVFTVRVYRDGCECARSRHLGRTPLPTTDYRLPTRRGIPLTIGSSSKYGLFIPSILFYKSHIPQSYAPPTNIIFYLRRHDPRMLRNWWGLRPLPANKLWCMHIYIYLGHESFRANYFRRKCYLDSLRKLW